MPRVTNTVRAVSSTDPADLASLGTSLNLVWVAADVANKQQVAFTGREIILARNVGASPHTVTVDGVKIKGRAGSIAAYSIAAGAVAIIALPTEGWRQTADAMLYFEANHAEIEFSIIRYT